MTLLIVAALGFLAIHLLPGTPLRQRLIQAVGEGVYLGAYSIVSLVFIALMVRGYGVVDPGIPLWALGDTERWIIAVLMVFPFLFAVLGLATPNPALTGAGKLLDASGTPKGVFTITRHPLMTGFAGWALLHLIANPDLPSLVFYGTFFVTAVWGVILQDRRKARELGAPWQGYQDKTSALPFTAIASGRVRLDLAGIGWWRPLLALVLWGGILHAHEALFGMPAIWL